MFPEGNSRLFKLLNRLHSVVMKLLESSRAPQVRGLAGDPDQSMWAVGNHTAMAWVQQNTTIIDI